jgi:hypothetical protein
MRLQLNLDTWLLFGAVVAFWATSALLAGDRNSIWKLKWRIIPLSFFGFAWIGFGLFFVVRFLFLAYDPVSYQNSAFAPWRLPTKTLAQAWLWLGIYWGVFCAGFLITRTALSKIITGFGRILNKLEGPEALPMLDVLAVATFFSSLVAHAAPGVVPRSVITPLGAFSALWVMPPTIAWYLFFRGHRVGLRIYLYLLPGIGMFVFSPYREHLLSLLLCIGLPTILVKRNIGLLPLLAILIVFLPAATIATDIRRAVLWKKEDWQKAVAEEGIGASRVRPKDSAFTKIVKRLHGYDSTAITICLVPKVFPYSQRNMVLDLFWRIFVPSAIDPQKGSGSTGGVFSTGIWARDDKSRIVNKTPAMIAPSMPGDLWSIGGRGMIVVGALIWGAIVGLLECCRRRLRPGVAVAWTVLLGVKVGGAIERDIVFGAGTVVQVAIVAALVLVIVLPVVRAKRTVVPA